MAEKKEYSVLSNKLSAGPHGIGDPDDKSLRKVEREVVIPKKIREKSRTEKCVKEVKEFTECAKKNGITSVYYCREENRKMFTCLEHWFRDEKFIEECTNEYLEERSIYRRTGVGVRDQKRKFRPKTTE